MFSNNTWGTIFYKKYDKMNFTAAQQQCASDGASLPLPKSGKLSVHRAEYSRILLKTFKRR